MIDESALSFQLTGDATKDIAASIKQHIGYLLNYLEKNPGKTEMNFVHQEIAKLKLHMMLMQEAVLALQKEHMEEVLLKMFKGASEASVN